MNSTHSCSAVWVIPQRGPCAALTSSCGAVWEQTFTWLTAAISTHCTKLCAHTDSWYFQPRRNLHLSLLWRRALLDRTNSEHHTTRSDALSPFRAAIYCLCSTVSDCMWLTPRGPTCHSECSKHLLTSFGWVGKHLTTSTSEGSRYQQLSGEGGGWGWAQ